MERETLLKHLKVTDSSEGLPNDVEEPCYKRTEEQTDDLVEFGRQAAGRM